MQTTPDHIIERNCRNARHSTGPRTKRGKAISRQNATRHGLCANPADGVVEDPKVFDQLHRAMAQRFCPSDAIEAGLVHRIAVCLWRLQRSALIDSAITRLQTETVSPTRERIHRWASEITQSFAAIEWVQVKDPQLLRRRAERHPDKAAQPWFRAERRFLVKADRYRDEVLMADGAAIQAMILLIRQLTDQLEQKRVLGPIEAQMLAWLLGESAERLVQSEDAEDRSASYYQDERPYAAPVDDLIGQARQRDDGAPLPTAFRTAIQARLTDLEAKSRSAAKPYTTEHEACLKAEAMLPDSGTLDRLIRYEGHAERGMLKAIETLSKLRGVTIESIRTTMTRPGNGEESLEVSGERTTWSGT